MLAVNLGVSNSESVQLNPCWAGALEIMKPGSKKQAKMIRSEKMGWRKVRNSHRTHQFSVQSEKPKEEICLQGVTSLDPFL